MGECMFDGGSENRGHVWRSATRFAVHVGRAHDAPDNDRRAAATKLAVAAIATGYGMTDTEIQTLPGMAATILDDARAFQSESMNDAERQRSTWRSTWRRENTDFLVGA